VFSTPRGEHHIGTLLLSLPSTYVGGALAVRQDNSEILFDWSQSTSLEWAFLYSDCEHEVLPVISGHRVTIHYNIFDTSPPDASDLLVSTDSRFAFFDSMIDALVGANNAVTLGFALRHEYPRDRQNHRMADIPKRLKGHDRVLLQAVQARRLKWELRVVWRMEKSEWEESDQWKLSNSQEYKDTMAKFEVDFKSSGKFPHSGDRGEYSGASYCSSGDDDEEQDEYWKLRNQLRTRLWSDYKARIDAQWEQPFRHRCHTSQTFSILEGAYLEEATWDYLENSGAKVSDDILWMYKPKQYDGEVSFTTYGNEAQTASIYTALALLVHIPGVEENAGSRKMSK
jgi:hypothetical protein